MLAGVFKHDMKQCWWETSSPVGQNRVSLISPEIRYLSQDSSVLTPNKEFIVFSWAHSCVHIYLYKESSSLLGTKWSFIHTDSHLFLVFPSLNKDPLCNSVPEFKHDQTQSVSAALGHSVVLTCTASIGLNHTDSDCKDQLEWIKDGTPLTNLTYSESVKDWWVYDVLYTVPNTEYRQRIGY